MRRRALALLVVPAQALALAACVPADEALTLGSVAFTLGASNAGSIGLPEGGTSDGWSLRFDRLLLGFKTMTIGKVGVADQCSYRGRGAVTDIVFDPRVGIVQTFNGIEPTECPDVGIVLGPPGDGSRLGASVAFSDLSDLAAADPAHAIVEATAERKNQFAEPPTTTTLRIVLRFDTARTSSRFGGCRSAKRGITIVGGARDGVTVKFEPETLFREAISTTAPIRVDPFAYADDNGDQDGVATMDELDQLPLSALRLYAEFYQLPDGTTRGSFGDYVRALFRFTFSFRGVGSCVGNEPGEEGDEGEDE